MAANQFIPPFPADESQDYFGGWLSGFSDGESSFILAWVRRSKPLGHKTGAAKFVIALRDDDQEIIEKIQSYLRCGTIHARIGPNGNPQVRLVVSRSEDLVETVIPHFERFPLRAKKRRDFEVWKEGVRLVHRIASRPMARSGMKGFRPKWGDAEIVEFGEIVERLNRQREYNAPAAPPKPKPISNPPESRIKFLFD